MATSTIAGITGISQSVAQQVLKYADGFQQRDGHLLMPEFANRCVSGAAMGVQITARDVADVLQNAGYRAAPGDPSKWYHPQSVFWQTQAAPNSFTGLSFLSSGQIQQQYNQIIPGQFPAPMVSPPPSKPSRRKFKDGDIVEVTAQIDGWTGQQAKIVGYQAGDSQYVIERLSDGLRDFAQANELRLFVPKPKVALDSVVISNKKKEEIKAAISQIKNDELIFTNWGFSDVFEKGTAVSLLFWGIPGTGKTLTAQAIADEIDGELKIIGTAEIQSSEPGGAERTIKEIFATAKTKSKQGKQQIILFDECDTLLMDRNEVGPILGAMVNALLTELEHHDGVVIFTTNRMGKLDPALERRITAKVEFEFPDKEQRHAIWLRLIPKKAPVGRDVDFKVLAEYPLAGGNIKNAVLNAAREAAYKKSKTITMSHFKDAIEREAKSLQAFVAEYEKTSHTSLAGYVSHSERGGIVVDRKAVMKDTSTPSQKKGDNF